MKVPCGKVLGHGERCCDEYLCASCEEILRLRKLLEESDGLRREGSDCDV